MHLLKKNHFQFIFFACLAVVIYNESLVYYLQTFNWPLLKCSDNNKDGCVKILIVSDPQILGEQSENPFLSFIFNWDSDRFLFKTYEHVVPHVKPDVILFLGDLMDEGSIATKEEFYRYVKRLSNIFFTEYPLKHVWIPGDNDIGGENEPIHPEKIKMFNTAFNQPDLINVKYVDIYKTNYLTQILPVSSHSHLSSNNTKVAISHMPLLLTPDKYTIHVLTTIQPAVIFSGHRHSASYLSATGQFEFKNKKIKDFTPNDEEKVMEINFKPYHFHEFIVPTCSYRMGVKDVGYGVAIIDTVNQKLTYAVLWSPQRFYHLMLYFAWVFVLLLYVWVLCLYKILSLTRACRLKTSYSRV